MNQIIDPTKTVKAVPFLPILTAELLRDFFAGCALPSIRPTTPNAMNEHERDAYIATRAYRLADAMLKAREQK